MTSRRRISSEDDLSINYGPAPSLTERLRSLRAMLACSEAAGEAAAVQDFQRLIAEAEAELQKNRTR